MQMLRHPNPETGQMGRPERRVRRPALRRLGAMPASTFGRLTLVPALERRDLLAPVVAEALDGWAHAADVAVVEIDPELADTAAMTEAYDVPLDASANCVVVSGKRAGDERIAACLVRADTRADVNNLVKRTLDVRKCSFHPMDRAVEETAMEYGGITPVGLPKGWRLLVDASVLDIEAAIIGSGVRRSKLVVPGRLFADLPAAEVLAGLGI